MRLPEWEQAKGWVQKGVTVLTLILAGMEAYEALREVTEDPT